MTSSRLLVCFISKQFLCSTNKFPGIEDDISRRDSLHAIINDLPDPNYATLRALVLVSKLSIL